MSYGVIVGPTGPNRIARSRTKLTLSAVQTASGVTIGANSFQIADAGVAFIGVDINVSAPDIQTGFSLELYDETAGAPVQSYHSLAYAARPEDQCFGFNFTADPTHQYSFYLTPDADNYSRTANYGLLLTDLNLRAEIKSAGGASPNDPYLLAVAALNLG